MATKRKRAKRTKPEAPEVSVSVDDSLLEQALACLQAYEQPQAGGPVTCADLMREIRARYVGLMLVEAADPKPAAHYWKRIGVSPEPIGKGGARVHWCGVFVLAMAWAIGLCRWRWRTGRGFLSRLPIIPNSKAQPGDLIYLRKTSRHHAAWVDAGAGLSVDGNTGKAPGTVAVCRKDASNPIVVTYSIDPLVRALAERVLAAEESRASE